MLLLSEPFQDDILNHRLEAGRQMYNGLSGVMKKRYNEMVKTKRYRNLKESLNKNDKEKNKPVWAEINKIHKEYGFNDYSFQSEITPMQHHFKKAVDSASAQKIATRAWKSFEKLLYGDGKDIHFKKFGEFNSIESKSNNAGIRFNGTHVEWMGLVIPVALDSKDWYQQEALLNEISFCRIVRKFIRGKYKYYVQLVLRGVPPIKVNKNTGEVTRVIGKGDVGIDIGTSTVAYCSQSDVKIKELADRAQGCEYRKKVLQRKMDRSRRAMNLNKYNADGTFNKSNKRDKWANSNHYIKYQNQLKEIHRKQTAIRKYQHECESNYILSLGDTFYVENMNFKGLAKRSNKTEKTEKGNYKRKKRFGKSVANRAPAMLLTILDRKLHYFNSSLIEINTQKARASQFNHIDGTYTKKQLHERWNNINGNQVQRDMYSAFLIKNINPDLETFDLTKCMKGFEQFLKLHNLEVNRLKAHKNLSSIAI
jgi:hypothetical protein